MRTLPLSQYLKNVSPIAYGCMGLGGDWSSAPISSDHIEQAHQVVDAALESGINFFDHADIYTQGKAELVFGEVLKQRPELRQQIYLQSKCAIRLADDANPGRYDHSKEWVTQSVDGILTRLNTEQLDVLLLHRPDPLMDVAELGETLNTLRKSGKVKHFGVSNMHRYQMELINSQLDEPLIANQLELSLAKLGFLEQGVTVAMAENAAVGFDAGTIEYCQMNKVQIQAWGSLCQGLFSGKKITDAEQYVQETSRLVQQFSENYQVSREAVVLGWLMRLPFAIQPVIGTTNVTRIKDSVEAINVADKMSREDWYKLYVAARGKALP